MSFTLLGSYAAGFVLAVLMGQFIVGIILGGLVPVESEKEKKKRSRLRRLEKISGFLDRLLFFAALVLGYANFIGLWILVKAAFLWGKRTKNGFGRRLFLLETALSVLFAAAGSLVVKLGSAEAYVDAGLAAAATLLLAFGIAAVTGEKRGPSSEGGGA